MPETLHGSQQDTAGFLEKYSGPPFFIGQPFTDEDRAMIKAVADLVPVLSGLLGKQCEIIVHSLEHPEHAAVAVANIRLSRRALHSPIQEQGLLTLREKMEDGNTAYFCKSEHGQRLKAAVYPIVNRNGRCIGGLSIALNLDSPLSDMLKCFTPSEEQQEQNRIFGSGMVDIRSVVEDVVRSFDETRSSNDRNRAKTIIAELMEKRIFNYRSAVQIVSECTGISPVTVYWHLRELKKSDTSE